MTCNRSCDCVGERKAGNDKPTTPTPGDLSARLLAESQRRESEWAHIPTNNPRSKFVHDERLRELLREAAAALSALPAAGGEQSELRALAHDMGAFLNANRASLPSKVIQDSYALHNRLNALAWATTPQPSAADDYESWAKQERQREDTATRLGSAAVGAQGDGYDAHEYMEERVAKDLRWFREERASRLAAPAAGKGVDDAMLILACNAYFDALPPHGGDVAYPLAMRAALEAALTRQPVAGDGMVGELVAAVTELRQRQRDYLSGPKGERSEEKGRLVGAAAARVDAALVPFRLEAMSQATARALAAVSGECQPVTLPNRSAKLSHDDYDWMYGIAPAATPTDGGEGKS